MNKKGHKRRGRWRAIVASGTAVGFGAVMTYAAFTDNAAFRSQFTVGSIDLTVNGEQGKPAAYTFDAWGSSLLEPGDAVYAPLTVANAGTLPLTYVMSTPTFAPTDSDELRTVLLAGVRIAATCDEAGFDAATGTAIVVPDGPLSAASIITARALAPQGSEQLCFKAELPTGAPDTIQGGTVTPTVAFSAVQTVS